MILVTGVTGHLGKLVLHHLLQRTDAANVAALARNPAKAEGLHVAVRQADYNDPASLVNAFREWTACISCRATMWSGGWSSI